jgi:DHA2 family lincomycin resistance protein-like MFS transporter
MRPQVGAKENRVIWLLLAAAFVAILNETTMGVAIPHLIGDLGITAVAAQWLTTAFMLTMAVVIPTTGFLLRRFTTRAMFATAMGLFSAGTLIALIAPGFEVLVAARVVQASGTAIMMPLLMTTLMTVVPAPARADDGPCQRGDLAGPAIGPTMAGIVLDNLTWRWIFAIVLPIALVALVVGVRWIHNLGEHAHADRHPLRAPVRRRVRRGGLRAQPDRWARDGCRRRGGGDHDSRRRAGHRTRRPRPVRLASGDAAEAG